MSSDERIVIRLGTADSAGPLSHVLFTRDFGEPAPRPAHGFGCRCCALRGALARHLAQLFMARARGDVAWFHEVVVVGEIDPSALDAAFAEDVIVAARFRHG